jgi:hypothetical protein
MEPRKLTHRSMGVAAELKEPLTQGDLEAFGDALMREKLISASQRRGAYLRAAISAGWFKTLAPEMKAEEVAAQPPAVVRLLGDWLDQVHDEVTAIPPE